MLTSLITGDSPFAPDDFTEAVAARYSAIRLTEAFAPRGGDFCYDGHRTEPKNLGWRCAQVAGYEETPEAVLAGRYDTVIAAGYHEAAAAEHYYRFEKIWD